MKRLHKKTNQPAASVEASSSAAQPASTKQPAASVEASSSAAQPASTKVKLDNDQSGGASGSAARPATLLEQVEQIGHYPKRVRNPASEQERNKFFGKKAFPAVDATAEGLAAGS